MNSRDYWERRAAKRMYEDMKTAEAAADDVENLYSRASLYVQQQGSQIFDTFRRETGLTEQEALKLLQQVKIPTDFQAILEYLDSIKDPAKRKTVIDWLNASATRSRLARLASLQQAIDNLVPLLYAEELKLHEEAYQEIIQRSFLQSTFDIQQFSGYGQRVAPLDAAQIDKLMRERWLGSNYSRRLWVNTSRLAKSLRDEMMVSFLTGRSQLEAWRAIDDEFGKGQHASRRLIRTESNYMANQAHLEAYKQAGIEEYIYVATLDLKTSKVCRGLDGKKFMVAKAMPGKNYPPMHPWCRSTTIAWIPAKLLAKMKRDALEPKTGRHIKIPANMTYDDWYGKFVG